MTTPEPAQSDRLDRMESDISGLKADVAELKTDMAEVKADVAELKTDMAEVKADVAELKTDMAEVKADVAELKTDVAELKTDMVGVHNSLSDMNNLLGQLAGDVLEAKAYRRIRPRVVQNLELRQSRILHSQLQETADELFYPVRAALDGGLITMEQDDRIHETDIIMHAQRKDDLALVWVAIEVSNTIDRTDIERARQSADILRFVFQQESLAVAVGYRISQGDQERAAESGVQVVTIPESR